MSEPRTTRNLLAAAAISAVVVFFWLRREPDAPVAKPAETPTNVAPPAPQPTVQAVVPSAAPAPSASEVVWTPEKKRAAAAEAEVAMLEAEEQKLAGVNFEAPRPVLSAPLPNVVPKRELEVTPLERLAQTEALSTALAARAARIRAELAAAKKDGKPDDPAKAMIAKRLEARSAALDADAKKLRTDLGIAPPDGGGGVVAP